MDQRHLVSTRDEDQRAVRTNWVRAGVKLVPYIGDALDELIYGRILRDLLLNAVPLSEGHMAWESARFTARLIAGLEVLDIAILVDLNKISARGNAKAKLRAVDVKSAELALTESVGGSVLLPFDWLVVDQAYRRVSSAPARLVISGPGGVNRYTHLALTTLGEFVVDWAKADRMDAGDRPAESVV